MARFCLIHGKWHDGSSFAALAEPLRAAGHRVVAPELPFDDPGTTYAARIRPALDALAGSDEQVVVVGHSLGAAYAALVADARPGAVLVYLCPAPVGPFAEVDAPMRSTREGFRFPPNGPDGNNSWDPEVAIATIYARLPTGEARALASRLKPGSSPADAYPSTGHRAPPTTFVYAHHDEFFEPDWSRWVAREVAGVEPVGLETGHFPMVEAPELVAEILLGPALR